MQLTMTMSYHILIQTILSNGHIIQIIMSDIEHEPDKINNTDQFQITRHFIYDIDYNTPQCHIDETQLPNDNMIEPQTLRRSTITTQNPNHILNHICSLSKESVDQEYSKYSLSY